MQIRLNILAAFLFAASLLPLQARAQTQTSSQQSADEVLRINTELVQTDVMVFDRRGRFVDALKPEQFVLNVDGEPKKISLFEQFAGAKSEAKQANATGSRSNSPDPRDAGNAAGDYCCANQGPARFFERGVAASLLVGNCPRATSARIVYSRSFGGQSKSRQHQRFAKNFVLS